MEKRALTLLTRETDEVLAFYAAPPPELMAAYDLPPGRAIVPRFGPDIESHIIKNNKNVFRGSDELFTEFENFISTLDDRFNQEDLISSKSSLDGKALEIRLAPQLPRGICAAFDRARTLMQDEAAHRGAQAFFGDGHWHVSLMMADMDILRWSTNNDKKSDYPTRLARAAMAGIYHYQSLFPALFAKPRIAEIPLGADNYNGPRQMEIGMNYDNHCTVLLARHGDGCLTIENRLGLHGPHQPVYLTLAAMQYGIENHGANPENGATHRVMTANACFGRGARLCRGRGGFLEMLRETQDNMARHPHLIPAELGRALLAESVRSYEEYLSWPGNRHNYEAQAMADLRREIAAFSAIPGHAITVKKITAPAP